MKAKVSVDIDKVKMAIRTGIPLSITTHTLPHEMEVYMGEVLTAFLAELNQTQMIQYLTYCLSELMINAKKANTKRVYFKDCNLDISSPQDYQVGMGSFKQETLNNLNYYLQMQKNLGLYVKLLIQMRNNKIKVEVRNNSELNVFEYKRIHDKLTRAQQYTSVEDAVSNVLDNSEGAGLGLIIMILMLKKIGLTEENFQVLVENGETITRIILPLSEETQNDLLLISDEFIHTIDELPQFPENISRLNRLLNDPDSKMSDIAMQISVDVALTGELLKLVNSSAFGLANTCSNITEAVKFVGIRGIKNLLFSIGSLKSFENVSGNKKELWTHAYQVAFYSYNLARNFCSTERVIIDDSYICGLLHDMGKIIFETAHPNLLARVMEMCKTKGTSQSIFEKLISGVNHGEIGARVAEKWNFPDAVVSVIRYHHDPENAPSEQKKLSAIVYLADLIAHYQQDEVDFYQIDSSILELFGIAKEEQFKSISDKMLQAFNASK